MSDINLSSFAQSLNFPIKKETASAVAVGDGQQIVELQCTILLSFPNHEDSFPLYTGQELQDMVESITQLHVADPRK